MQYYVIVNQYEKIPLFDWNVTDFNAIEELHLATSDLVYIKTVFQTINLIKIVDEDNNEMAEYTVYDSYANISYEGTKFSQMIGGFFDKLNVKLRKTSLTEEVKRINDKVNKVIDIDSMSADEYREYLLETFSEKGQQIIFNGTEVTLTDGQTKLFTYNLEDQSNLLNALFTIQALGDLTIVLPYHCHAEPCSLYSAKDILLIYFTLQFFSTRIQTRVNMLCSWVRNTETKEELEQIKFDSELPEEYMEKVNEIMGPTYELAETLMHKYFPDIQGGATEDNDEGENENETVIE